MANKDNIQQLVDLLTRSLQLFEEDRQLALTNYNNLRSQMDSILEEDAHMSEEGSMERLLNDAVSLVFKSSQKLEAVINTITKITINELNNESRERVAQSLSGSMPKGPVSFNQLMDEREVK
jgi:restriction endonuclease Mrr